MQRLQRGVADQLGVERQHSCQLVAAPVDGDAQEPDIGHGADKPGQQRVAAGFDHLDGFMALHGLASLDFALWKVKAPVAAATGRAASSSHAVARTKATERVTW